MTDRYAILQLPSVNHVYNAASGQLVVGELQSVNAAVMGDRIKDIENTIIGGVSYLTFTCEAMTGGDVFYIANLSFVYALFAVHGDEQTLRLRPIKLEALDRYDSDLLSILKFAGKTNQHFTRMLLNVTLMASSFAAQMQSERLTVFDPLCGRGTTLNQALMYGYHAAGIEMDHNDYEAYRIFINRWLKDKRLKHKSDEAELRKEKQHQARRLSIRLAADKSAYKSGDVQTLDFLQTDTLEAGTFFKAGFCQLIVTDLPYGVKHGNRSTQGLAKSPLQLLTQALPVWTRLLCQGGAIGIAWNTHLAAKTQVIGLLENAGLSVNPGTSGNQFRHRVDQAILRDIVVATRF